MNFNMQQMMKKAQELQKKMQDMQTQLEAEEVEGKSGGGMVTVVASCKGMLKKVNIDKSLLQESEKEMLEDLIVAAINNAKENADAKMNSKMSAMGISPDMLKFG